MAVRFRRKKNISVIRIGMKIGITVVVLYASGLLLSTIGDIMNETASPYYQGLRLIGWTLHDDACGSASSCTAFNATDGLCPVGDGATSGIIDNCISDTNGTGVLAIIGLLAIVWIVFEFLSVTY